MEGPVRYRRQESKRDCWSGEGEDASEMGRRTRSTPELKRKKHMLRQVQACDRTSGSGFEGFEFRRNRRKKKNGGSREAKVSSAYFAVRCSSRLD
jgi:hypothetical protein